MLVSDLTGVFEPSHLQDQKLPLGDLVDHPGQFLLHQLVRGNGLVPELLAQQRVLERTIVTGHGGADGAPGDAVSRLVQAHEG